MQSAIFWTLRSVGRILAHFSPLLVDKLAIVSGITIWWLWGDLRRVTRKNLGAIFQVKAHKLDENSPVFDGSDTLVAHGKNSIIQKLANSRESALAVSKLGKKIDKKGRDGAINQARLIAHLLSFPFEDPAELLRQTRYFGMENLNSVLGSGPLILLTPHLGNWERMAAFFGWRGCDIGAFYLQPKHKWLDKYLKDIRKHANIFPVERDSLRESLKIIRRGGMLGILADHDGGPTGQITEFFGQKISFPPGPGALARRSNGAILPCICLPTSGKGANIYFFKPIIPEKTKDRERDIAKCNQEVLRFYEKVIRRWPQRWLLSYDRFKKRRHIPD